MSFSVRRASDSSYDITYGPLRCEGVRFYIWPDGDNHQPHFYGQRTQTSGYWKVNYLPSGARDGHEYHIHLYVKDYGDDDYKWANITYSFDAY